MVAVVVLDACVLHPMMLCDTLLRMAMTGLFRPVWTEKIVAEMVGSLERRGYVRESVARRAERMKLAFPYAMQHPSRAHFERVPEEVHPKDRHVVAAAIVSGADAILTANVRDFRGATGLGIAVVAPDDFLTEQFANDPDLLVALLDEHAGDLSRPSRSLDDLLRTFAGDHPKFSTAVRTHIGT